MEPGYVFGAVLSAFVKHFWASKDSGRPPPPAWRAANASRALATSRALTGRRGPGGAVGKRCGRSRA
eukprot:4960286-Lingulodinium_polyedra.AAC.1